LFLIFCLSPAAPAFSQLGEHEERMLLLDARWQDDSRTLRINWDAKGALKSGGVAIDRRALGNTGGGAWQPLAQDIRRRRVYVDETVQPGKAYEYRVTRTDGDAVQVGYWLAGQDVPAVVERGVALLAIEESLEAPLAAALTRFGRDLLGDGWQVVRHTVPRHNKDAVENLKAANALRAWVGEQVGQNPERPHSLILFGHVPIVKSGQVGPDGHGNHPHEADLYYANIGPRWAQKPDGTLLQSVLPGLKIDLPVGRIDFASISGGDRTEELQHLAHYLDKNHAWRHGELGDLRNAYAQNSHLFVEQAMLRNIVGPEAITQGGHHDAGVKEPHLWGVDFGHWKGSEYPGAGIKPVFAINFGSGKQHFAKPGNPMVQLLAQPDYTLAVGWGARPAWWLQHMALGGTIGDVHLRTVNNGPWFGGPYQQALDYYPTGRYLWRGAIWVNLLGDPTLHAFPLLPPSDLKAISGPAGVTLDWDASPDVAVSGYRVFRRGDSSEPFLPISEVISKTKFSDAEGSSDAEYMVRAYGRKQVYAGSFYTYSQGVFVSGMAR
jgi:hypothetical protein